MMEKNTVLTVTRRDVIELNCVLSFGGEAKRVIVPVQNAGECTRDQMQVTGILDVEAKLVIILSLIAFNTIAILGFSVIKSQKCSIIIKTSQEKRSPV